MNRQRVSATMPYPRLSSTFGSSSAAAAAASSSTSTAAVLATSIVSELLANVEAPAGEGYAIAFSFDQLAVAAGVWIG